MFSLSDNMEGDVYFLGDSADESFSGQLDDDGSLGEQDVIDFIRASRPDLLRQLRNLPVATSEILHSTVIHRQLKQAHGSKHILQQAAVGTDKECNQVLAIKDNDKNLPNLTEQSQLDLILLQHRYDLEYILLHGCTLTWHTSNDRSDTCSCSHPYCLEVTSRIRGPDFVVTLKPVFTKSASVQELNYCLECLIDLFEQSRPFPSQLANFPNYLLSSDGLGGEQAVCASAESEKMVLKKPDGIQEKGRSPLTSLYHYPSNSQEAQILRENKRREIDDILKSVERQEHKPRRKRSFRDSPDLRILRPTVPQDDKPYKKQGLTGYDRQKWRVEKIAQSPLLSSRVDVMKDAQPSLYCYCREPIGSGDWVMYCAAPSCLIGVFHLQCCGISLEHNSKTDGNFYCTNCSASFGSGERSHLTKEPPVSHSAVEAGQNLMEVVDLTDCEDRTNEATAESRPVEPENTELDSTSWMSRFVAINEPHYLAEEVLLNDEDSHISQDDVDDDGMVEELSDEDANATLSEFVPCSDSSEDEFDEA